jgi:hypothetical protein
MSTAILKDLPGYLLTLSKESGWLLSFTKNVISHPDSLSEWLCSLAGESGSTSLDLS